MAGLNADERAPIKARRLGDSTEIAVKDYYCHCYGCGGVVLALASRFVEEEPYRGWLARIKGKTDEVPHLCTDCGKRLMAY